MNYCTKCGHKLPPTGECPYCTSRYYGKYTQPVIQTVLTASKSYTTLVLACFWTLSTLCLLIFSALAVNPLLLVAAPGVIIMVGLWMIFGGVGHTRRMGYTFIATGLQIISIFLTLALAVLCMLAFLAIFLCTSYQSYEDFSAALLLLSLGLLIALPVVVVFLHKLRRIATTTRSVLLRSRPSVELSLYAILMLVFGAGGLAYAALHLTTAERFLTSLRPMLQSVLPSLATTVFFGLTGQSWSGMMVPLMMMAVTFLYTALALLRYQFRHNKVRRQLKKAEAEAKAQKLAAQKAAKKAAGE